MMATQFGKTGSLTFDRGPQTRRTEKPKSREELGLCVALVVMVGWALYAGLHNLDWAAIGHTVKVMLASIG